MTAAFSDYVHMMSARMSRIALWAMDWEGQMVTWEVNHHKSTDIICACPLTWRHWTDEKSPTLTSLPLDMQSTAGAKMCPCIAVIMNHQQVNRVYTRTIHEGCSNGGWRRVGKRWENSTYKLRVKLWQEERHLWMSPHGVIGLILGHFVLTQARVARSKKSRYPDQCANFARLG